MTTAAAARQLPTCPEPPTRANICYLLGDFFGDRVFNLESGVDFNEVVFAVLVHQELHGAGVLIAHLQQKKRQEHSFIAVNRQVIMLVV